MNNTITLHKQPGASYRAHAFKVYDVTRNGEVVGTVESDFGHGLERQGRGPEPGQPPQHD